MQKGDIISFRYYGGHTPNGETVRIVQLDTMGGWQLWGIELTDNNKYKQFNIAKMSSMEKLDAVNTTLDDYLGDLVDDGTGTEKNKIECIRILDESVAGIYALNDGVNYMIVRKPKVREASVDVVKKTVTVNGTSVYLTDEQLQKLGL